MSKDGKELTGFDNAAVPRSGQHAVEQDVNDGAGANISRRAAVGRLAFFGAVMSALSGRLLAQQGASGSYSNSAIAMLPSDESAPKPSEDLVRAVKIARAMRSGPPEVTRDATVAEMDHHGNMTDILRKGTNAWVCTPGDENKIGDPPMCVDELGMQWFKDAQRVNHGRRIKRQVSATCCVAQRSTAIRIRPIGQARQFRSARTG